MRLAGITAAVMAGIKLHDGDAPSALVFALFGIYLTIWSVCKEDD
jgi:hypothetical protein